MHYWLKIYGDFSEWILPIGGAPAVEGLLSTEPMPSSFLPSGVVKILLPAHIIAYQYHTLTEYTNIISRKKEFTKKMCVHFVKNLIAKHCRVS